MMKKINLILVLILLFSLNGMCASSLTAKEEKALRMMCYNVHNCKGMDGQFDYERIAGVMNSVYDSDTQLALKTHFTALNNFKENTIPVVKPNRCIDFIYKRNSERYSISVLQTKVLSEEQVASDHLPLFVEVCIATK
ncbi:MAG: hypothetical protein M0P33_08415 [Massilibacteroides sp.]|nr:hypothetical protein [Massilibacteroides sp.]